MANGKTDDGVTRRDLRTDGEIGGNGDGETFSRTEARRQNAEGRWQNQMMGRTLNCGIQRVRRGDKGIRGSGYQDIGKNKEIIRGETLT